MAATNASVCALAALMLKDTEVTAASLKQVVEAAGHEVPDYYYGIFASVVGQIDIPAIISSSVAGPSAAPAGGAAPTSSVPAAEEKKAVESEESDDDMGFSLFD